MEQTSPRLLQSHTIVFSLGVVKESLVMHLVRSGDYCPVSERTGMMVFPGKMGVKKSPEIELLMMDCT